MMGFKLGTDGLIGVRFEVEYIHSLVDLKLSTYSFEF